MKIFTTTKTKLVKYEIMDVIVKFLSKNVFLFDKCVSDLRPLIFEIEIGINLWKSTVIPNRERGEEQPKEYRISLTSFRGNINQLCERYIS